MEGYSNPTVLNGSAGNSAPVVGGKRKLKLVTRKAARKALKMQPHGQGTFSSLAKGLGGTRPAMRGLCRLGLGNGGSYLGIVLVPLLN